MKVLVTGATGFLGEYIAKELSEKGYRIIAFGRNGKKGAELALKFKNTVFVKGNFENIKDIENIEEDVDGVIHAGGLSTIWGKWEDFYKFLLPKSGLKPKDFLLFCKHSISSTNLLSTIVLIDIENLL